MSLLEEDIWIHLNVSSWALGNYNGHFCHNFLIIKTIIIYESIMKNNKWLQLGLIHCVSYASWWLYCTTHVSPPLPLNSTNSTVRCPGWSPAWWAVLLGCTPHLWPLGGRTCHRPTAVTPAHLCIHPAMPPLGTCTPPWALAGTQSTNTRSISPASPISMERPPQAGLNSLQTLICYIQAPDLPHRWMQSLWTLPIKYMEEEQRVERTNAR